MATKTILKGFPWARYILVLVFGIMCMGQAYAFLPTSHKQIHTSSPSVQVQSEPAREIVVLIHGLMRTSLSMWPLKNYLKRQGYEVYSYSYPSPKYSIQEHGLYLNQFIKNLLKKNPGVKINFITHSLGGIITRQALSGLPQKQLKNIGCLIMLAPPNQGSKLAKMSTKMFPMLTTPIKPLAELSSDQTSYVHRVPVPNIKIGIIAGRYDAKVPPDSARLQGQNEPVIVNSNHTFIMNNAKTRQLIMSFLKTGSFAQVRERGFKNS
ncbi:alpha/beta fold hydrolase [Fluoribacter dumoffii]|uniref:Alpha/beta hydrolase family n=1 Tax=Fluoribacter dumoffii TaxID=463 RepID=A0A377GBQ0_9GAMM|nr:alpha/beta fold hydrolase [Fluoribacter dumoffii]KTC90552.1 lipase LipB [Fluoribacter dumoffii NY 23]MCW8386232.1 alpha/beta fold hydrolase [Fluoribacter dumoffii]MCW8419283.1 alpha/beta fold hydrolase [Fluoribacter dumoffii]MCW8452842.1 alpha/beta fold hydrolase [Fluoribacter dumoffii]MCW8459908.1 alpha/beta fold hydrolase [Fluoribacter dumoffii]